MLAVPRCTYTWCRARHCLEVVNTGMRCILYALMNEYIYAMQAWLPVLVWQRQCTVFPPMLSWTQHAEQSHHGIS